MNIVDIYDNGGYESAVDRMLTERLTALSRRGHSIGAMRREGRGAEDIARFGRVSVSSFGFLHLMSYASQIYRLTSGNKSEPIILHTHAMKESENAIMMRDRLAKHGLTVRAVVELSGGERAERGSRTDFVMKNIDLVIFNSGADKDSFMSSLDGELAEEKTAIVHPTFILPSPVEKDAAGNVTLIWGNRIRPECGLPEIVEALGRLKELPIRLIAAGQGKARQASPIVKRIKTLGLKDRVEFPGDKALDADLLGRADIAVLPSAVDPDILICGAAAMASGLPLITSRSERTAHLCQDHVNALLYDTGDIAGLTEAIRRLATDPELRQTLRAGARAKAEAQYDISFALDKLVEAYESILP